MVQDYAPTNCCVTAIQTSTCCPLPSVVAALQALATGQADAMIGDLASSVWSMRQLKLKDLQVSGETPYRYQLAMAAPKSQATLIGILDKLFAELSAEEIAALQEPWVGGVPDSRSVWHDRLPELRHPHAALALLILAAVLRVNRRLHQEVNERMAPEGRLRDSELHLPRHGREPECHRLADAPPDYCFTMFTACREAARLSPTTGCNPASGSAPCTPRMPPVPSTTASAKARPAATIASTTGCWRPMVGSSGYAKSSP